MTKPTLKQFFDDNEKNAGTAFGLIRAVPVKAGERVKLKGDAWAFVGEAPAPTDGWQVIDDYYPPGHEKAFRFMTRAEFDSEYILIDKKTAPGPDDGKIKLIDQSLKTVFEMSSNLAMDQKESVYAVGKVPFSYIVLDKDHSFSYGTGTEYVPAGAHICRSADGKWRHTTAEDFRKCFLVVTPPPSKATPAPGT